METFGGFVNHQILAAGRQKKAVTFCMLRHDDIIVAGGTMDDRQCPGVINNDDARVLAAGLKSQVAGLRAAPGNSVAITVLGYRTTTVSDYVFTATSVIEHPIDKSRAIKSEWTHLPCGRAETIENTIKTFENAIETGLIG